MAVTEPRGSNAMYLSIRDGRFWQRVNEDHPKAKKRTMTKEGYEGKVVYEVEYASVDGWLTDVSYDPDGKFGPEWKILLKDDSGDLFVLNLSGDSIDWNNIAEVLPALDLKKQVMIVPWKNAERKGIILRQVADKSGTWENVRSFYKTFEYNSTDNYWKFTGYKYGFPDYTEVDASDADDKKSYWLRVRKFLRIATLKWVESTLIPEVNNREAIEKADDFEPFDDFSEEKGAEPESPKAKKPVVDNPEDDLPF